MDTKPLKPVYDKNYSTSYVGVYDDNCTYEHKDLTVKNEDFFAALHILMKNKHKYMRNIGSTQQDDNHKVRIGYCIFVFFTRNQMLHSIYPVL